MGIGFYKRFSPTWWQARLQSIHASALMGEGKKSTAVTAVLLSIFRF